MFPLKVVNGSCIVQSFIEEWSKLFFNFFLLILVDVFFRSQIKNAQDPWSARDFGKLENYTFYARTGRLTYGLRCHLLWARSWI